MQLRIREKLTLFVVVALIALLPTARAERKAQLHPWIQPTAEELSMKSIPELPGASAVILNYEEIDDASDTATQTIYERIKILNDDGKQFADQELRYAKDTTWGEKHDENYLDVEGRTIHADGTVIPFTGTPFERTVAKVHDFSYVEKVFTLPDVQVGSIIEFHYSYKIYSGYAPVWYVQKKLFLRHGYFKFIPSTPSNSYSLYRPDYLSVISILPKGVQITKTGKGETTVYALSVDNVMPVPDEEFMPPISHYSLRASFYYQSYATVDKYWKGIGDAYSKAWNEFMNPGKPVKQAVEALTAPTDTPSAKLKKIYDSVEALENTDYIRERTRKEEKAMKLKDVHNINDVLKNKGGTSGTLTLLFVGMARAAGFKAYAMAVTNRDENMFDKNFTEWSQLDDLIAIVQMDGKDYFYDPGEAFCKFEELAWKHSDAGGIRQTADGSDYDVTPPLSMSENKINRTAVLTMDEKGNASGQIQVAYEGVSAMAWRQDTLEGDPVKFNKSFEDDVTALLPTGAEVKLKSFANLTDADKPLVVNFTVQGQFGTTAGKHVLMPGDIFRSRTKPVLVDSQRITPLYFDYRSIATDIVRVQLPAGLTIESLPEKQSMNYKNQTAYAYKASILPNNTFQVERQYALGNYFYPTSEYEDMRQYFAKLVQSDQGVVLLKPATATK